MDINLCEKLEQTGIKLCTRISELLSLGIRFESVLFRAQDVNTCIKKFKDTEQSLSKLTSAICGYDGRYSSFDTILVTKCDPVYLSTKYLCLNTRKCIIHEGWDTLRMNEIETELLLSYDRVDFNNRLIQECADEIQLRKKMVQNAFMHATRNDKCLSLV